MAGRVFLASAYAAVLAAIEHDVDKLLSSNPGIFSFQTSDAGFTEVRDFQTTGVIAFAKGLPFFQVKPGKQALTTHATYRVQVKDDYLQNARTAMKSLVARL
jgi:hypothetical protein